MQRKECPKLLVLKTSILISYDNCPPPKCTLQITPKQYPDHPTKWSHFTNLTWSFTCTALSSQVCLSEHVLLYAKYMKCTQASHFWGFLHVYQTWTSLTDSSCTASPSEWLAVLCCSWIKSRKLWFYLNYICSSVQAHLPTTGCLHLSLLLNSL